MRAILPLPPSINSYYSQNSSGHRYKTGKATDWETEAGYTILSSAGKKKFGDDTVGVNYYFYMPDNRSDYGNRAKILDDFLEKNGIVDNDRQIIEAHIYKYIDKENPRVEVEVFKVMKHI